MADLVYPFANPPDTGVGQTVEVAPGVLWLRMPLGGSLAFINVWALADEDGWTLVDTGLHNEATLAAWQTAMAGSLGGKPIKRIIATHMHPDHVGMVGWFVERMGVRLWMTKDEYLTCRLLVADTGRSAPKAGLDFYRAAGWDASQLEGYAHRFGGYGRSIYTLPDSFRRIADGETLRIGERAWLVVVGSGHSPEHACLYCPELKLMISGDQVLPAITSNVSVFPTEPDADPLRDWLESIDKLADRLPDDLLVLPAHNAPFFGLHARLAMLARGHLESLEKLEAFLDQPRRVIDIFPLLFRRPIVDPMTMTLATGETRAHLNRLWHAGKAGFDLDQDGVAWWRQVA